MKLETLDVLKIPYEIEYTDKLVSYLMRIAECRPFFTENLSKPLKVSLLRNAKVRAITYSNQIEGNTLSETEVGKLISKKKKDLTVPEILEIQNYADALGYAEKLALNLRTIKISDFCDLQRLITEGLIQKNQVGRLRTITVSIVNSATNEQIDSCPEPHHLKSAVEDLWKWLDNSKEINPFVRAFAFHFIAVAVHPFADGNGRTCRLMQHHLLLQSGEEIVRYVPSETVIMNYRDDYYKAIRLTKKLGKLNPILEFLAFCFAEAAEGITKEAKAILKETESSPQIRHGKILALVKSKKEIKTKDVVLLFPKVPRRTLERDLETLCKNKMLEAFGQNKARVYRLMM
ncbi:MAG: Fic family protein [Bacteriovoracaceae bacterium]